MKTSFEQTIRPFVPVVSHVKQPEKIIEIPRPDVGLRWGKPSDFTFTEDDTKDKSVVSGPIVANPQQTIVGTEVYREFDIIRAEVKGISSLYFDFERPTLMVFRIDSSVEETENTSPSGSSVQPITTYIEHYIQMSFPLSEHGNVISSGNRGTNPEDEALNKQIAYYNGGGSVQFDIISSILKFGQSDETLWRVDGIPYKWLHR